MEQYYSIHNNIQISEKDRFLLQLFCFGTVQDMKEYNRRNAAANAMINLTANQMWKLRQLSLVSLVHSRGAARRRRIPYVDIAAELDVAEDVVEQIIISCVYGNLVRGKMDHRNMCFDAHWAVSRDVCFGDSGSLLVDGDKVSSLDSMIEQLECFHKKTNVVMTSVIANECVAFIDHAKGKETSLWNEVAKSIDETRKSRLDHTSLLLTCNLIAESATAGDYSSHHYESMMEQSDDIAHNDRKIKRSRGVEEEKSS